MVVKVDFKVVGEAKMHCGGCESRVRFALGQLPGVQQVLADSKTQQISVLLNPGQVTTEQVQERLKAAGYEAAMSAA